MFRTVGNIFRRPLRCARTAARFTNTAPFRRQANSSGSNQSNDNAKSYLPYGCGFAFAGMAVQHAGAAKVETVDDIQIPEGAV